MSGKNKKHSKENEILSAIDVAKYFLILVDREEGDTITHLKLQKLMYFAQGIHLALYDQPLFKEDIEAWPHGPVVPEIYHEFKGYGHSPIPLPFEIDFDTYTKQIKQLIYKINSFYGEHSAVYLRNLTHQHAIWQEAIASAYGYNKAQIQKFFKTDILNDIKDYIVSITQEDLAQMEKAEDRSRCRSLTDFPLNSALGTDDFHKLVVNGDLFVDKSLMIKELLDNASEVILIARPRRWGKSINMSMIRSFFEIEADVNGNVLTDEEKVNKKLFVGGKINLSPKRSKQLNPLKIASVPYVMERQGRFPVIFLSLKDIKGNDYQIIEDKMREKITNVFEYHKYLTNSSKISDIDKQQFQNYLTNNITIVKLHSSLLFLSKLLFEHFKQRVYILIDEYDTLINEAYIHFGDKPEFNDVNELFSCIFGSCLKSNKYLEKGVITGILRIAKANLFSDLNNVTEYTRLDNNFSKFYGFTEQEVSELLSKAPVEIEPKKIKDWYYGYKVGKELLYNPWSIMQCIVNNKLDNYWLDSGGTALIKTVFGSDAIQEDLQRLLENKKVTKYLYKQISFMDINDNTDIFFSLLVFAGFLNAELDENSDEMFPMYNLSIPNQEIRTIFIFRINAWIRQKLNLSINDYDHLMKLLTQGELDKFFDKFKSYLIASTSHHDFYCERDYHNLMGGMFASLSNNYRVKSNIETGHGRLDHLIIPHIGIADKAFIFEYKTSKEEKELVKLAQKGLDQITDKAYSTTINDFPHINGIFKISIAFCGKKAAMEFLS